MTAHLDNSPNEAAADVLRAVAAARRRVRTVSMVRLAAIAGPAGVAMGAALALTGRAPAWTAAALGAAGVAGAMAWAAGHTPAPAAVARLLDARLGLRDRVAAALQLHDTGGPIAALVARDAAARLAPVRLTVLFPLTLGRGPAVATALAAAVVAWLASSGADRRVAPGRDASTEGRASDGREAGGRARGASRAARTVQDPEAAAPRAAALAREPRRGETSGGEAAREARGVTAPGARQAGQPPTPAPSESPVNPGANRQPAAATAGSSGTTARTASGGAAAGAPANGGLSAGAGGATPGSSLAATHAGGGPDPGVSPQALAGSSATARANAEAALARDVIPPDYRDHVRAYFRTLPARPAGTGGSR